MSGRARWIVPVLAAAAAFAAVRLLPVDAWLGEFQRWVGGIGPWGGAIYGAVYVVGALLFVPGSLLTIGAGLVFGLGWGTLIVSAASTTTAAIAFLVARHLARERVQAMARRHPRFEAIDRAIADKGWTVVALLRLSPVVPFSLSNYLYGLTPVRFVPYVVTSWVAMLPGTLLYVWLGAAGGAAAAAGRGEGRSPWEWGLLAAGLVATVVVTVLLTRAARRELERMRVEGARG
ncbi:MAG TPA: TVP38/TMEM64 family protein [Vicinamibacteria bacterium]|nr:TVP38/TMEM64 family protein [Vicinamibacteria bacterium]